MRHPPNGVSDPPMLCGGDILTGWTETICVENKSQVRVFEVLRRKEDNIYLQPIRRMIVVM